jgi:hypothetical protein
VIVERFRGAATVNKNAGGPGVSNETGIHPLPPGIPAAETREGPKGAPG